MRPTCWSGWLRQHPAEAEPVAGSGTQFEGVASCTLLGFQSDLVRHVHPDFRKAPSFEKGELALAHVGVEINLQHDIG